MTAAGSARLHIERAQHSLGLALDDAQKCARRPLGATPALLPVLHCLQIEPEARGKLCLSQSKTQSNSSHIRRLWHMRDEAIAFALCIGERLARTSQDIFSSFRHLSSLHVRTGDRSLLTPSVTRFVRRRSDSFSRSYRTPSSQKPAATARRSR